MKVWSMFCKDCGQAIERGHKFCGNCGQPVPQEQIESEAVIAQAATAGATSSADPPQPVSVPQVSAPPSSFATTERNRRNAAPSVDPVGKRPCPRCKKLIRKEERVCEWCGREIRVGPDPVPAGDAVLSFAGYADSQPAKKAEAKAPPMRMQRRVVRSRRSSAPIVEILVVILLLGGAAMAVWIMRSSLPASSIAMSQDINVTATPASARVAPGKTLDVLATVSGSSDVEVNWSIQEGDEGGHVDSRGAKAARGKVWSQAVYTAPKTGGTYHLVAESKVDPDKSAVVVITVANR